MSPDQFEQLIQVLLHNLFGFEAAPFRQGTEWRQSINIQTVLAWPAQLEQGLWDGNIGIQAHFIATPAGDTQVYDKVPDEIAKKVRRFAGSILFWRQPGEEHTKSGYLLVVTNIRFQEAATQELRSLSQEILNEYGLDGAAWWTCEELSQLIDQDADARRKFAGFLVTADAFRHVHKYVKGVSARFSDTISRHVAMELIADQWTRLTQAGDPAYGKLPLSQLVIDLPLQHPDSKFHAAQYILRDGDRVLRAYNHKNQPPHVVILGGPGAGKSTIAQVVCQAYRAALLSDSQWIGEDASKLLRSTRASLARIGLDPRHRRWPIRIELAAYADVVATKRWMTILQYISDQVASRTSDEVKPDQIRAWLHSYPWLLVLDGLDEVASAADRDTLTERISEFLVEAARQDADLFTVITTRPQGYSGEFASDRYKHLTLDSLSPQQAATFANRLAKVRHADDPDMCTKLIRRTEIAAKEESTARLMRTPLQVTIMSFLLEARERAPQARYALFEAYYDTIYAREAAKPGSVGRLIQEHRSHINALHDRVGLLLQVESEKTGGADAAVSQSRLRELAIERLLAEGYVLRTAEQLSDDVLKAVTSRLVLIVPKAIEDVEFEVRSIQEFFAARAIVSGSDVSVIERLQMTIVPVHWRNTWLLAAGRVFAQREHIRPNLIALLAEIDTASTMNLVVTPGADLAVDLLDDDLTASTPRFQRMFADRALTLLNCPPDPDLERRALILFRNARRDKVIRAAAEKALEQALRGTPAQVCAAGIIKQIWSDRETRLLLGSAESAPGRKPVRGARGGRSADPHKELTIADLVRARMDRASLTEAEQKIADELIRALALVTLRPEDAGLDEVTLLASDRVVSRTIKDRCFSAPAIADAVAMAAIDAAADTWVGASELRNMLRAWMQRRPVGEEILSITPFTGEVSDPS